MPPFSPQALAKILEATLPAGADQLCVALSGGLDSSVLLHALRRLRDAYPQWQVRAVHVDHQLHPHSARWAQECAQSALRLGVPFVCTAVTVTDVAEAGLEAAARKARYDALAAILKDGEVLLTAHHADDQFETLLLALLRGSGVAGLAAMPLCTEFRNGLHLRPLLSFSRVALERWAEEQGILPLQDPANAEQRFDRNYLRHSVIPVLKARWPAAVHTASRSAAHLADADALLDDIAAHDLATASVGNCLQVDALRSLHSRRRRNLLRYWIRNAGFMLPSTRKLAALEHDMLNARADTLPCTDWRGAEVRRHDGLLYLMKPLPEFPQASTMSWSVMQELQLPAGLGSLRMMQSHGAGVSLKRLPDRLQLRFRRGGERLKPRHSPHHRTLKCLLHDAHVLPWWRERLPLIYAHDELIAVADLWVADAWAPDADEDAVRIVWRDKPGIVGEVGVE